MIRREDLERVASHRSGPHPVLSLFLDMSVDATNRRTYSVFLQQKRAEFPELDSGDRRVPLGILLHRIERWLAQEFGRGNRGAAIYAEIGGDWFEALEFPVPVANRMIVGDRPVITPLAQLLSSYHHHGVVLIDREHVRILSVYLGTLLDEIEVRREPDPLEHELQNGGYAHQRYQRRKRVETRQAMHDFAAEVERFVDRYAPDDLVILGTAENVARLKSALPDHLRKRVIHTGPARVDDPASHIVDNIEPLLRRLREEERSRVAERLHDRVRHDHLAAAGVQRTLAALQSGRVETLVVGDDDGLTGSRCPTCGFIFGPGVGVCMYDGSSTEQGVVLVEELVRIAGTSGVGVEFVDPTALEDLRGVGALLKY
jgi:peptide subunit release factor 1 (eRF1)